MPLINLSVKHGRTLDEARAQLQKAVADVQFQFGALVQTVEWNADQSAVHLAGAGAVVDMCVDPQEVHVTADLPILGRLLGGPLAAGLKSIVEQKFQKRLPGA